MASEAAMTVGAATLAAVVLQTSVSVVWTLAARLSGGGARSRYPLRQWYTAHVLGLHEAIAAGVSACACALFVRSCQEIAAGRVEVLTSPFTLSVESVLGVFYVADSVVHMWQYNQPWGWLRAPVSGACLASALPSLLAFPLGRYEYALGSLRALRIAVALSRLLDRMRYRLRPDDLYRLRLAEFVVQVVCWVFVAAGFVFTAENTTLNVPHGQVASFFEAFYFIFVTAATVGYGDITPQSTYGKILVLLFIVLTVSAIPMLVDRFARLWTDVVRRSVYSGPGRHVLVIGRTELLGVLLDELLNETRASGQGVATVVMAPVDLRGEESPAAVRDLAALDRVALLRGDAVVVADLERARVREARAVFVLSEYVGDSATLEDDRIVKVAQLVRTYAPRARLYVQCQSLDTLHQLSGMGAEVVLEMQKSRMVMLAQACLCPGAATILANMLHFRVTRAVGKTPVQHLYERGAAHELFRAPLPLAMAGLQFWECASLTLLASHGEVQLLGLIILRKRRRRPQKRPSSPSIPLANPYFSLQEVFEEDEEFSFSEEDMDRDEEEDDDHSIADFENDIENENRNPTIDNNNNHNTNENVHDDHPNNELEHNNQPWGLSGKKFPIEGDEENQMNQEEYPKIHGKSVLTAQPEEGMQNEVGEVQGISHGLKKFVQPLNHPHGAPRAGSVRRSSLSMRASSISNTSGSTSSSSEEEGGENNSDDDEEEGPPARRNDRLARERMERLAAQAYSRAGWAPPVDAASKPARRVRHGKVVMNPSEGILVDPRRHVGVFFSRNEELVVRHLAEMAPRMNSLWAARAARVETLMTPLSHISAKPNLSFVHNSAVSQIFQNPTHENQEDTKSSTSSSTSNLHDAATAAAAATTITTTSTTTSNYIHTNRNGTNPTASATNPINEIIPPIPLKSPPSTQVHSPYPNDDIMNPNAHLHKPVSAEEWKLRSTLVDINTEREIFHQPWADASGPVTAAVAQAADDEFAERWVQVDTAAFRQSMDIESMAHSGLAYRVQNHVVVVGEMREVEWLVAALQRRSGGTAGDVVLLVARDDGYASSGKFYSRLSRVVPHRERKAKSRAYVGARIREPAYEDAYSAESQRQSHVYVCRYDGPCEEGDLYRAGFARCRTLLIIPPWRRRGEADDSLDDYALRMHRTAQVAEMAARKAEPKGAGGYARRVLTMLRNSRNARFLPGGAPRMAAMAPTIHPAFASGAVVYEDYLYRLLACSYHNGAVIEVFQQLLRGALHRLRLADLHPTLDGIQYGDLSLLLLAGALTAGMRVLPLAVARPQNEDDTIISNPPFDLALGQDDQLIVLMESMEWKSADKPRNRTPAAASSSHDTDHPQPKAVAEQVRFPLQFTGADGGLRPLDPFPSTSGSVSSEDSRGRRFKHMEAQFGRLHTPRAIGTLPIDDDSTSASQTSDAGGENDEEAESAWLQAPPPPFAATRHSPRPISSSDSTSSSNQWAPHSNPPFLPRWRNLSNSPSTNPPLSSSVLRNPYSTRKDSSSSPWSSD